MDAYNLPENLDEFNGTFEYVKVENLEIIDEFFEEATELLSKIEANLLVVEKNPIDYESIDNLFRCLHSIKGSSAYIGLNEISILCHWAESLLDKCRSKVFFINESITGILLEASDLLKLLFSNLKIKTKILSGGRDEFVPAKISISPAIRKFHSLLTTNNENILKEINSRDIFISQDDNNSKKINSQANITEVSDSAHETSDSVRVTTKKLDAVSELTGELLISLSLLKKQAELFSAGKQIFDQIHNFELNLDMLRMNILKMRMLPIKTIYDKLNRQIRDLSKKLNKKINYETEGGNVEIDKSIIDEIFAPLTHIIRNCIDHGIENAEDRVKKSKSKSGTVRIITENKCDSIVVTVSDDGAGLNKEKLLKKAIEKNIYSLDELSKMSDTVIYNLIFHPGFSTAEKVTETSGRGVGMDVVKKSVEKLGGNIEITSTENIGAQFKIILPLAASIIDGLITEISGVKIIFSILKIKFTLTLDKADIMHNAHDDSGFIIFQNRTATVIDLDKFYKFNTEPEEEKKIGTTSAAIIVEYNGTEYALLVKRIISKDKIVSKKLIGKITQICGIKAGTILGDGSIGFIIEPSEIIDSFAISA